MNKATTFSASTLIRTMLDGRRLRDIPLFLLLLLLSKPLSAQTGSVIEFRDPGSGKVDRILTKVMSRETAELEELLLAARREGNDGQARYLLSQLESRSSSHRVVPVDPNLVRTVMPLVASNSVSPRGASPLWGDDIIIYQGVLRIASSNREIAVASDTLGGIYAAAILALPDSVSQIAVFKSTDYGTSWMLVNGVQILSFRYQSFALTVTDTSDGKWVIGLVYVLKPLPTSNGGSLMWTSFLDDGTGWRTSVVAAADPLTEYRGPAAASDGYFYTPGTTWHYAAAERISPSTGRSRGITAFRSADYGGSWPVADTTFSFGVEDAFPAIAVQAGIGTSDTVLVAFDRRFPFSDRDIRLFRNSTTFSGTWVFRAITSSLYDEFGPSLAVSTVDESSLITYTRNTGPQTQWDALYAYTSDTWRTFSTGSLSSDSGKQETLTNSSYSRSGTTNQWHVSYHVLTDTAAGVPDTIIYKTSASLSGVGDALPVAVNKFRVARALRPAIGAHRQGPAGAWVGHVAYSTTGFTNLFYDGFEIPVSVNSHQNVPFLLSLGQNYPNPFNPVTSFKFQVPSSRLVELKVYDVLGREVATLVNELKAPGEYEVRWDASGLASGVYFYVLKAGPHTEVRRMVLLK